jgi:hypothetical protein
MGTTEHKALASISTVFGTKAFGTKRMLFVHGKCCPKSPEAIVANLDQAAAF